MAENDAETNKPRRRRYNRESEVVTAAVKVFWRKGYAASTIQDIADEVGVLKGSLYHYVQSKEDLLLRIFLDSGRQAAQIEQAVADLGLPPMKALRMYFERYVRWYLDNMERVSLYSREWKNLTGERLEEVRQQRRVTTQFVEGLIRDASADGSIPSRVNQRYATYFILGAANGIPDWYRPARDGFESPEAIARMYADLAMATLNG